MSLLPLGRIMCLCLSLPVLSILARQPKFIVTEWLWVKHEDQFEHSQSLICSSSKFNPQITIALEA